MRYHWRRGYSSEPGLRGSRSARLPLTVVRMDLEQLSSPRPDPLTLPQRAHAIQIRALRKEYTEDHVPSGIETVPLAFLLVYVRRFLRVLHLRGSARCGGSDVRIRRWWWMRARRENGTWNVMGGGAQGGRGWNWIRERAPIPSPSYSCAAPLSCIRLLGSVRRTFGAGGIEGAPDRRAREGWQEVSRTCAEVGALFMQSLSAPPSCLAVSPSYRDTYPLSTMPAHHAHRCSTWQCTTGDTGGVVASTARRLTGISVSPLRGLGDVGLRWDGEMALRGEGWKWEETGVWPSSLACSKTSAAPPHRARHRGGTGTVDASMSVWLSPIKRREREIRVVQGRVYAEAAAPMLVIHRRDGATLAPLPRRVSVPGRASVRAACQVRCLSCRDRPVDEGMEVRALALSDAGRAVEQDFGTRMSHLCEPLLTSSTLPGMEVRVLAPSDVGTLALWSRTRSSARGWAAAQAWRTGSELGVSACVSARRPAFVALRGFNVSVDWHPALGRRKRVELRGTREARNVRNLASPAYMDVVIIRVLAPPHCTRRPQKPVRYDLAHSSPSSSVLPVPRLSVSKFIPTDVGRRCSDLPLPTSRALAHGNARPDYWSTQRRACCQVEWERDALTARGGRMQRAPIYYDTHAPEADSVHLVPVVRFLPHRCRCREVGERQPRLR
ncbi:hypothetical protein DFH07DRAFT_969791 [Mycena maculata]|uniref:Uncharacterized protein n=1 Tax=Mycena maculata TaxID=230809 RepID=A0AAD7HUL3_9AGAR|nr:hypothetical protein DFH07DRAFT_969791 [Mycena maculata]